MRITINDIEFLFSYEIGRGTVNYQLIPVSSEMLDRITDKDVMYGQIINCFKQKGISVIAHRFESAGYCFECDTRQGIRDALIQPLFEILKP